MIQWPEPAKLSRVSASTLERFKLTGACRELEDDARAWHVVSWSWLPDAPHAFTFRSEREERYVVMEADGRTQVKAIRPAVAAPTY